MICLGELAANTVTVDISEATLSSTSIYPNPTEGELYINFGNSQMHIVQIKNLMGQVLYEQDFSGLLNTNIDLSSYDKGCYLITISNSNVVHSGTTKHQNQTFSYRNLKY